MSHSMSLIVRCTLAVLLVSAPLQASPDDPGETGKPQLSEAALEGDIDRARQLLAQGANINIRGGGDHTPLMAAAAYGEEEMVRFLLANGADGTLVDAEGESAVDRAERTGHPQIAQLIRDAFPQGAKKKKRNPPVLREDHAGPAHAPVQTQAPAEVAPPAPQPQPPAPVFDLSQRDAMRQILQRGIERDLAPAFQAAVLERVLRECNDGQIAAIAGLVAHTTHEAAQVFLLKAMLVGEPWENLVAYGQEMHGVNEDEVIRRSTMRDAMDVIQQWQDACGPTMLQTAAGEADPRFAWEINKLGDVTVIDPYGTSALLATQQKAWLEQYGGTAVPRGETGVGIPMLDFLNGAMGPMLAVNYACITVTSVDHALAQMDAALRQGYDVPLCIAWDDTGTNNHFVLTLNVRGDVGRRDYLIHDTWTGRTDWIAEGDVRSNRLPPIFGDGYARVSHYYQPLPK